MLSSFLIIFLILVPPPILWKIVTNKTLQFLISKRYCLIFLLKSFKLFIVLLSFSADQLFEQAAKDILKKKDAMFDKYRLLLLEESMVCITKIHVYTMHIFAVLFAEKINFFQFFIYNFFFFKYSL